MKNVKQFSKFFGTQFVLLAALSAHAAPSASQTAEPSPEPVIRESVFQDEAGKGKDPFFPKSSRRAVKLPSINAPVAAPIVQLSLKGISGSSSSRLALINNRTFAVGETASVRIVGGSVNVRCVEINENSVVVTLEGDPEPKELQLRKNL